jgi:ATP phosphoribosyltransferase regulatory subunit
MNGSSRLSQVPPGVQCFVGAEARRRRAIEEAVVSVFEGWDYEEIIPPLFDYADVFAGPALGPRTYSFVGRDGSLLALRPDFTSLLAKVAAGRLADRQPPIRLFYSGEVLRYEPPKAGRQSELHQMGLELLGGRSPQADAEVLAVAAECLQRLGVRGCVLTLGHVGVFAGLLQELPGVAPEALRDRLEARDVTGLRGLLAGAPVTAAAALLRLAALPGETAVLREAAQACAGFPSALRAVEELGAIVALAEQAGLGPHLAIDLAEVRGLDYYTGLVFRAYAPGLGFEVGSGGRYDGLLARFGRPLPAVGFMLGLDRLALLLDRQGAVPEPPVARPVATRSLGEARALRAAGERVRLESTP